MFHPERLQGYLNPEPQRWVEWLSVSLMLVWAGHWLMTWIRSRSLVSCMSWRRLVLSTFMMMFALEVIGRQTLLQLLPLYNLV